MTEVVLSSVAVVLKENGNTELVCSSVPVTDFRKAFNKSMPNYENTELLCSFLTRLERITKDYTESIEKLL